MKLWIGHYLGDPREWFMVWANTKEDAIGIIDAQYGEPDVRSLKQIDRPGCMGLFAKKDESDEEGFYFLEPNLDDPPILERSSGITAERWVEQCITKPFGPPENVVVSQLAEQMGIQQAEVLARHFKDRCPNCIAKGYDKKMGCHECGYKEPTV